MEIKTINSFKLNEKELKEAIKIYCVNKLGLDVETINEDNIEILSYLNNVAIINDTTNAVITIVKTKE